MTGFNNLLININREKIHTERSKEVHRERERERERERRERERERER